ncbi:MAG: PepSY domain-containing protein [Gemmatimonadaceae bacterium]
MTWKRVNYLVHRWMGIILGVIVAVWFLSGIMMMYYPYPELTARERLENAPPLRLPPGGLNVSFADALRVAGTQAGRVATTARLLIWRGRAAYALYAERGVHREGVALVDATSGTLLSPLTPEQAVAVASERFGLTGVTAVELLPRSDHYYMGSEKKGSFPVFRVRFDDAKRTAVYVTATTGEVVAKVDRFTRVSTWLGTVPHWLYFQNLYYDHFDVWLWISIVLPGAATLMGLSGMVLGAVQLFPRRRRGSWRVSGYHGVSKWHHVFGLVFGALVFTWNLSGMLEVLGPSPTPTAQIVSRSMGDAQAWESPMLDVRHAVSRAESMAVGDDVIAVDHDRVGGQPGYVVHFRSHQRMWVDATTGSVRRQIDSTAAITQVRRVLGEAPVVAAAEWQSGPDAYYYPRNGGDLLLPVWRVVVADADASTVYLDPTSGHPVAVVTNAVRRWRWWRDGLHDFDFPALRDRRPLWDIIVLTFMIGGAVSSVTGLWLLFRRLWRLRPGL